MSEHYPAVLRMEDERGGVTFRLGVREFVEGVRRAGRPAEEKGKERAAQADEDDIEMTPATVPETYSTPPETPSPSLDDALLLGRSLHTHYGSSVLPYVQEQLRLAFSLLAYEVADGDSGLEAAPNEVRRLLSDKEREKEADEINALILGEWSSHRTMHTSLIACSSSIAISAADTSSRIAIPTHGSRILPPQRERYGGKGWRRMHGRYTKYTDVMEELS